MIVHVTVPSPARRLGIFVNTNREATRVLLSQLRAHPNHFMPNPNQSFVLEILEADGVVEFSNRFVRQTLLREIAAALEH